MDFSVDLTILSIIAFSMSLATLSIAIAIFLGSKRFSARVFTFMILVQALWVLNHGLLHGVVKNAESYLFFVNNSHFLGSVVAGILLYFSQTFPNNSHPPKWIKFSLIVYFVTMIPLYYFLNDFMIYGVHPLEHQPYWTYGYGPGGLLFTIPFFLFWVTSVYTFYMKSKQSTGKKRFHLLYMFWAMIAGFITPSIVSVILPSMGIFHFAWMSSTFNFIWIAILSYSIVKYDQMNVRVVYTELLVLVAIFLLFISIFI